MYLIRLYKNAFSGLARETWLLSLVMLINRCGSMVGPFMTLYLTHKYNYNIAQAGLVMASFGAGAVCGGLLGGWFSDRIGFYYVQIIALSVGGLLFFVLGEMDNLYTIGLVAFFLALINDAFRPANAAAISHYSADGTTTKSFTLNRMAINLGWSLGGALGGFLAAKNYHWLFWIDGFSNLFAAFCLWFFLAPSRVKKHNPSKAIEVFKERTQSALKDMPYLLFIFLNVLFALCFFQIFTTLPVYYRDHLYLNEIQIGWLMGINGLLIALLEMIAVHNIDARRHPLQLIFVGTLFLSLAFLVFNFLPGTFAVALISILIFTVGEIFAMPFMNTYWNSRTNATNRGQYAGLFTMAWAVAQIFGPVGGAQLAFNYGFTVLWWCVGGLLLLVAFGYLFLRSMK